MNRRLIGESLPLKLISDESTKEKNIHSNHISALHLWFARRPLTASRATAYAALIDPAKVDRRVARQTLDELSYYKNTDNLNLIEKSRRHVLKSNDGVPPKVLDPFGGGGSIPLECVRLGCETYSNDYNPVAHIIQKCTLEYPLKYGKVNPGTHEKDSRLVRDITRWSEWIEAETRKELDTFFPSEKGHAPYSYIWAKTIPCQNPKCGAMIPILTTMELNRRTGISMCPIVNGNHVSFIIVGGQYGTAPATHDPKEGTIKRSYVTCPCCKSTIKPAEANKLLNKDPDGEQLIVVIEKARRGGKVYRPATKKDIDAYDSCKKKLTELRQKFIERYEIDPIPTESIGTPNGNEYESGSVYWVFNGMHGTGYTRYEHMCNYRQKLVLVTMLYKIREACNIIQTETDENYAKCMACYLGLLVGKLTAVGLSRQSMWKSGDGRVVSGLSGSAIKKVVWYGEISPFDDKMGILRKTKSICEGVMQSIRTSGEPANVTIGTATRLNYPDEYFDAVFTDPPYYDFVAYSDFSDFFYVWLKRSIGHLFPELFTTALTAKRQELVANEDLIRSHKRDSESKKKLNLKTKEYYENGMSDAISEMYRVLKHDGILTLVYTHSSLDGWETLIKAMRKSGFVIIAAWPLSTETEVRISAQNKASVQSSIYMVARKWEREPVGFYTNVKKDMFKHLASKLGEFGAELSRVDYFIAAIGFALEWFTKYNKVVEDSGKEVTICTMLKDIRQFTIEHKMQELLGTGITGSGLTKLYVLYRWTYGGGVAPYDAARKLFQGCGINMEAHYKGLAQKQGDKVRILDPFGRGSAEDVPEDDLVNILHKAILLREANRTDECNEMLKRHGYDKNEAFYRVAAAIVKVHERDTMETKRLREFVDGADMKTLETLDQHLM